ncbi:MAG TPA: BolA family protein [Acetobacteraceae bacterium]|nr:BolA family protein [Acetobacteraceae bacterium]
MQTRKDRIAAALCAAFAPGALEITDDSARHAGHAGARAEGETHFSVRLVSPLFRGRSRVERARAVHEALGAELRGGLHALSLTLQTPEESAAGKPGPASG